MDDEKGSKHDQRVFKDWKYIYMANGRREQLFNLSEDPNELNLRTSDYPEITASLRQTSIDKMRKHLGLQPALCGDNLCRFEYRKRPLFRIHQFDISNGINDFTMNNKIDSSGKTIFLIEIAPFYI